MHERYQVRGRIAINLRAVLLNAHLHHDLHLIEAAPWHISGQHLEDETRVKVSGSSTVLNIPIRTPAYRDTGSATGSAAGSAAAGPFRAAARPARRSARYA